MSVLGGGCRVSLQLKHVLFYCLHLISFWLKKLSVSRKGESLFTSYKVVLKRFSITKLHNVDTSLIHFAIQTNRLENRNYTIKGDDHIYVINYVS